MERWARKKIKRGIIAFCVALLIAALLALLHKAGVM